MAILVLVILLSLYLDKGLSSTTGCPCRDTPLISGPQGVSDDKISGSSLTQVHGAREYKDCRIAALNTAHPPSTLHHHRDSERITQVWETSGYDQKAESCNPVESPLRPFPSIYRTADDIVGFHGPPISGQTVRR
ncbi:hypothetical protein CAPTEDRAFT_203762 [Capitella teleta]|uniref:Uncharacterized protein n=1 Tax=Capitella teleta TaxID=283909 RepID=R7V495_CAPTE|nr:hypothetical protein CAPTEDRAFT_203762 [Capitella teleta]|eukprot:ELU13394.1 hypothetical protein CAPTEDRAFT_203762 [Capitella teleta]